MCFTEDTLSNECLICVGAPGILLMKEPLGRVDIERKAESNSSSICEAFREPGLTINRLQVTSFALHRASVDHGKNVIPTHYSGATKQSKLKEAPPRRNASLLPLSANQRTHSF